MSADTRVRIVIDWQGVRYFFVRMDGTVPNVEPPERVRNAALLSREVAVAVCRKLREGGWQASVVTPSGVILYEEAIAPHSPVNQPGDRTPMHCAGVLIVPGNPPRGGWWVRFPNTTFESLWGETPEAVYEALTGHPQYAKLKDFAERYTAPEPPPVDPAELQRQFQRERYGSARIRPGSL
jgi:hypothetical protein